MSRIITTLLISASLAMWSAGAFAKPKKAGGPPQMPPTVVETAKVIQVMRQNRIQSTGSLSAFEGIVVRPEVAGRITKIYFDSGTFVRAGTPLVQLNPDILKAEVESYAAQVKMNKLSFERQTELYKKRLTSRAILDKVTADYQVSLAGEEQAKAQLKQTLVRAPFSGRLGLRQVSLGDFVTAGQALVNLQAVNPLRVDFSVPQVFLDKLAVGETVILHVDAYPDQTFQGKVFAFDSLIDAKTRSLGVRATIPNKSGKLLPGIFTQVTLLAGKKQNVVVVPQTAIVSSEAGDFVYRVIKERAINTPVTLGPRGDKDVVIKSGLRPGETVVTAGTIKLHSGAPVVVRTSAGTPAPRARH